MCEPTTIAIALGAATAGTSIIGQRQQARTQEKVQRNATIAEQQRHLAEVSAMRMKERQEMVSSAQQRQEITRKAREARATASVSAGEAGVAGLSVDALLNEFSRQEGSSLFSLTQQEMFNEQARAVGLENSALRHSSNLLRINKPIAQPNYLGAILDGAQTGLSTYSAMNQAGFGAPKAATSASAASTVSSAGIPSLTAPTKLDLGPLVNN